jgi:predicted nucleic acid-binding protein
MQKVFIDTNVCLDMLAKREPYNEAATLLFNRVISNQVKGFVSALSFVHLEYHLRRHLSAAQTMKILTQFKSMIIILPVTDKIIEWALGSDFADFEDAVQHYTAISGGADTIITRDIKGFKKAECSVMNAEEYLKQL